MSAFPYQHHHHPKTQRGVRWSCIQTMVLCGSEQMNPPLWASISISFFHIQNLPT